MMSESIFKNCCLSKIGRISVKLNISAMSGLILLAILFSGCSMVGPDYVKPTAPEPEKWLASNEPKFQTVEIDVSDWWTVFSDPVLNMSRNSCLVLARLRKCC